MQAEDSLALLQKGAAQYELRGVYAGDVSMAMRKRLAGGQKPWATVVTCSDSRVVPEAIFGCGLGEIFVIRTAGSVIGAHELASIEYAAHHLYVPLTVVLGHTHCGAVGAAIDGASGHYVRCITDRITKAIGSEKDPYKACCLNVLSSAEEVKKKLADRKEPCFEETEVRGAIFSLEDGTVKFL